MLTVADVRAYLRIDSEADDAELSALISASSQYLKNMTSKSLHVTGIDEEGQMTTESIDEDGLFQTAVKLMVAHWYENRQIVSATSVNNVPHSAEMIMQSIALSGDYE